MSSDSDVLGLTGEACTDHRIRAHVNSGGEAWRSHLHQQSSTEQIDIVRQWAAKLDLIDGEDEILTMPFILDDVRKLRHSVSLGAEGFDAPSHQTAYL